MTHDDNDRTATSTAQHHEQHDDGEQHGFDRRSFLKTTGTVGLAGAFGGLSASTAAGYSKGSPPIESPWYGDVSPSNAHTEYPRPQMERSRWRHLNGLWGFETASSGDPVPTGQRLGEEILVPYPVESALSGLQRQEDRMWYRRTFSVPSGWDVGNSERLLVHFEAVDYDTTVYVNGQEVGGHVGSFDHFVFDVTDHLTGGTEELIVNVADPTEIGQTIGKQHQNPNGIWYTPTSGIWQSVWMEPVPNARVDRLDTTPDVANEQLSVTAETTGGAGLTVEAIAYDDSGSEVGRATGAPGSEFQVPVPSPTLWSPDSPYLYDLEVRLLDGGTVVDSVSSYFGMRSVGKRVIDGTERLTLNGEFVFNVGTLDQGYWPGGIMTPPTDEALRYDLERHEDMGFNMVRKHIKVESRRWFYHADQLGLLVWQDMINRARWEATPDSAARAQYEQELTEMIEEVGNHPSINVWIPFNEGWGDYEPGRITDLVRSLDDSRIVNTHSGVNVCGCPQPNGDVLDWHAYPGPGTAPPSDDDRATAIGEFGGYSYVVDGHTWGSNPSCTYDCVSGRQDHTDQYVRKMDEIEALMRENGISAAVWTQITDVENEVNGLMTYDREVDKVNVSEVAARNQQLIEAAREDVGDATAPVSDGTYEIENVNSGKMLDVSGGGTADGTNIQQWPANGLGPQQWTLVHLGDGLYSIQNVNSGKYMSVEGSDPSNDATVWQWSWVDNPDQKWSIAEIGDGEFRLTASHSGRVAEVYAGETTDGANVQQYDDNGGAWQRWRFNALDLSIADGTYEITNVNSGKALDVNAAGTADGTNVQQWTPNGTGAQQWDVTHAGNGQYTIQNVNSGKYLSVEGSSAANDATVWQWSWEDNDDQRWSIHDLGGGEYRLSPTHSNNVLEVIGGDTTDGANVQQYAWNDNAWQKWSFPGI